MYYLWFETGCIQLPQFPRFQRDHTGVSEYPKSPDVSVCLHQLVTYTWPTV